MDHVEDLDPRLTPATACGRVLDLPGVLLLESAAVSERLGRYSFLMADPFVRLRARGGAIEERGPGRFRRFTGDPFHELQRLVEAYPRETVPGLPPFQGGAAGYLAYDLVHHLERVPHARLDDLALPDMAIGLYDWVIAWDHVTGRVTLLSTGLPEAEGPARWARARRRAAEVRARLEETSWSAGPGGKTRPASARAVPRARPVPGALVGAHSFLGHRHAVRRAAPAAPARFPVPGLPGIRSTFSRRDYLASVARTREYILAGDIFQANLSQRLEAGWAEHPFELYRALHERNPAPFAAYLDLGDAAIVSASPERFLRVRGGMVETRPIKGTAPRGVTPQHDLALERALQESEKDRAENVMIVDLMRNDLSRVCRDHSVEVPELCIIERYPSVHHLVSTVVGRLEAGRSPVDLLRAAFPGGSVTGAPKVRAMEIIAELEPTRRGVYTGSIGYLGFDGAMDTSIVIRTFVLKEDRAYFQVGGGIVADSDPEREYRETLAKADGLLRALEVHDGAARR